MRINKTAILVWLAGILLVGGLGIGIDIAVGKRVPSNDRQVVTECVKVERWFFDCGAEGKVPLAHILTTYPPEVLTEQNDGIRRWCSWSAMRGYLSNFPAGVRDGKRICSRERHASPASIPGLFRYLPFTGPQLLRKIKRV